MTETFNLNALLRLVADLAEKRTRATTDHHSRMLATIVAALLEEPSSQRKHLDPQPFRIAGDGESFTTATAMATYISEFGPLETLDCLATTPDLLNCTMKDAAEKLLHIRRAIQSS